MANDPGYTENLELGAGIDGVSPTILSMNEEQRRKITNSSVALSVEDIVRYLDVSANTVRRWIRDGHLRAVRMGPKLFRILPQDFEAFLAAGGVPKQKDGEDTDDE